MKENKLVDLSVDFAIKIIKLCETIKGHNHYTTFTYFYPDSAPFGYS